MCLKSPRRNGEQGYWGSSVCHLPGQVRGRVLLGRQNWSQPHGIWLWRDRWDLGWELALPLVTCDLGGSLNLNKTQPSSSIKHGHLLHGSLQTSNGSAPAQDWRLHGGGVVTWTGTVWGTAVDFTCLECAFQGKTNCSALDKAGGSITQIGTTSPPLSAHFPTGFFALSG